MYLNSDEGRFFGHYVVIIDKISVLSPKMIEIAQKYSY